VELKCVGGRRGAKERAPEVVAQGTEERRTVAFDHTREPERKKHRQVMLEDTQQECENFEREPREKGLEVRPDDQTLVRQFAAVEPKRKRMH
jgi:hypothetical protein